MTLTLERLAEIAVRLRVAWKHAMPDGSEEYVDGAPLSVAEIDALVAMAREGLRVQAAHEGRPLTGRGRAREGRVTLGAITQRVKPVTEQADDKGARSGTRGKARTLVGE